MLGEEVSLRLVDAMIGEGADASVPFGELFVSPVLQRKLEDIERGTLDPGGLRYVATHHSNYS